MLTSGYRFGGSLADLAEARAACSLPLLRKDFVSGPYQVLEARAYGASAVLLIADALPERGLQSLVLFAEGLGMDALVEAHSREGLLKAGAAGARLVGINNRDLASLAVDIGTTERLMADAPAGSVVVSESGIGDDRSVRALSLLGVDALLIGEELMRARQPARRLRELLRAGESETMPEEVGHVFRSMDTVSHRGRSCAAPARRATESYSASTGKERNAAGGDAGAFECKRIHGTEH